MFVDNKNSIKSNTTSSTNHTSPIVSGSSLGICCGLPVFRYWVHPYSLDFFLFLVLVFVPCKISDYLEVWCVCVRACVRACVRVYVYVCMAWCMCVWRGVWCVCGVVWCVHGYRECDFSLQLTSFLTTRLFEMWSVTNTNFIT